MKKRIRIRPKAPMRYRNGETKETVINTMYSVNQSYLDNRDRHNKYNIRKNKYIGLTKMKTITIYLKDNPNNNVVCGSFKEMNTMFERVIHFDKNTLLKKIQATPMVGGYQTLEYKDFIIVISVSKRQ